MQIRKGYKYRLKTNRATRGQFVRFAGACRFVWNKILAINEGRYLAGVPRLSYADSTRLLTLWKHSEEYGWLHTVHSQVLQQCLKDLDRAYVHLFHGRTQPLTYRKKFLADAFRCPQGFQVDGNQVYLPKIGWVRFWKSRPIEGTVKNVTVSRQGTHWFVAFQVEIEIPDPVHPCHTSQTCPECGHISAKNRVQQALFSCEQCGYSYHADVVAARNILARGQRERQNAYAHPAGVPGIPVL